MAGNTSQPSIKRVWGIAKSPELKLTDEELHLLVQAHTGKDSIKALNKRELQTVIRVLGSMKDSVKKSERGKHSGGNTSTENQRKKIYKLTQELGWDKPARVNGMCRKMFGVSAVEWLDYQQCSKLIEALKNMVKRQEEKEGQDAGLQALPPGCSLYKLQADAPSDGIGNLSVFLISGYGSPP